MDSIPNSNAHLANDKELQTILITKIPPQNTTPENRNQTNFLRPVEKKPIGFLDLPFEIRNMIYKLCFVRSFGIVPCFTYQKSRTTFHDRPYRSFKWVRSPHYRYRFEGNEQFFSSALDDLIKPSSDGSIRPVYNSWHTNPTPEQYGILEDGGSIEDWTGVNYSQWQAPKAETPINEKYRIGHTKTYYLPGFFGVKLLRTCKQINAEGCEILYGGNNFVFRTENVHHHSTLRVQPHHIPGFLSKDGSVATEQQTSATIDKIFDRHFHHPGFNWEDPILHFFYRISRHNSSLIKSVKIIDSFNSQGYGFVNFIQLLPIYALVFNEVCVSLGRVNLCATSWRKTDFRTYGFNTTRVDEDQVKTNTEDAVAVFVNRFPGLRELEFGDFGAVRTDPKVGPTHQEELEETWGDTLRWRDIVKKRDDTN
jgi:hypothetical protein